MDNIYNFMGYDVPIDTCITYNGEIYKCTKFDNAEPSTKCDGCSFISGEDACVILNCHKSFRKDSNDVVFLKYDKNKDEKNTIIYGEIVNGETNAYGKKIELTMKYIDKPMENVLKTYIDKPMENVPKTKGEIKAETFFSLKYALDFANTVDVINISTPRIDLFYVFYRVNNEDDNKNVINIT